MLAVVSNFVNVDEKFYFYLLNFLHSLYSFTADSVTIKNYAGFALVNFVKNRNLDDRQVKAVESDIKTVLVGSSEAQTDPLPRLFHRRKLRGANGRGLRESGGG